LIDLEIIATRVGGIDGCNPCRARAKLRYAVCYTNQIALVIL
jgi:hypothetical protein